jgi:hypothetical protein
MFQVMHLETHGDTYNQLQGENISGVRADGVSVE